MLCSPASGPAASARSLLGGFLAGVLSVLCVALPLTGHLLARGHVSRWGILVAVTAVASSGIVVLRRSRLTDTQLLTALAAAHLTDCTLYALPGVEAPEHIVVACHLVTLVLGARLLGLSGKHLWRRSTVMAALRRLLAFVWPMVRAESGPPTVRRTPARRPSPRWAALTYVRALRAPPALLPA